MYETDLKRIYNQLDIRVMFVLFTLINNYNLNKISLKFTTQAKPNKIQINF